MKRTIPRKIHFIWYGDNYPEYVKENLRKVKEVYPDYEVKVWGANDFDPQTRRYTKEAVKAGKWAFVSDYLRVKILYENGGIYLDTDMVAVKNADHLLEDVDLMLGFEYRKMVTTGFVASIPKHPLFKEVLDIYEAFDYLGPEDKFKFMVNNELWTYLLVRDYGLKLNNKEQMLGEGIKIVPFAYFSNGIIDDQTYFQHDHKITWTSKRKARVMAWWLPRVRKHWVLFEPGVALVALQMKFKNRARIKRVLKKKKKHLSS